MKAMIPKIIAARTVGDTPPLISAVAIGMLVAMIVASLYLGREVLVPLSLAILLSFVLAPPVALLQKIGTPKAFAVIVTVLLAFAIIFAVGSLVATQLNKLAGSLPLYQATMEKKVSSLKGLAVGSGTLERAADMLQDLSKEINKPKSVQPGSLSPNVRPPGSSEIVLPLPVEVHQPDPGAMESLRSLISPLISPLATTGITVIFVIFILLQREDLRNRFIRLAGSGDLQRTTAALDDAGARLSRLLLNQLMINSGFGVLIGIGLWIIGVPSAILWGVLTAVLRFVPYIGSIISAAFPLTLAAAVDPGWSMLAWTAALFFILEPIIGQVVEPMVYGKTTGLSPVAVVVSAAFWTAIWGPIGLVLATPLTVCLVVVGRHVESLKFLDVMFGDQPALSPAEIFYQRMLAGDPNEAAEKAEAYLKERSLSTYYDDVAVEGLGLAQADLDREVLNFERIIAIRDTVNEFIEDIDEEDAMPPKGTSVDTAETVATVEKTEQKNDELPKVSPDNLAENWRGPKPILCISARTPLDEAAAAMFAQLCRAHGLGTAVEAASALSTSNIDQLQTEAVALVCVSSLGSSISALRYMVRRLRRKLPNAKIMIGLWSKNDAADRMADIKTIAKSDLTVSTFQDGLRTCIAEATSDSELSRK